VKRKRFSVEQIVATLKQIELGMTVAAASRQLGVSEQAIYRWKKQYGGLQSVAELSLDKSILQDINAKKWPGPR